MENEDAIAVPYFFQQYNDLYPVSQEVVNVACAHAAAEYPLESCGIVFGGKYYPVQNSSETPTTHFEISINDQLRVCQPDQVEAVIHSHPSGVEGPSLADMIAQQNVNVPYGIIVMSNDQPIDVLFFGDGVKRAPLFGRPFKAGVYDCFSMARETLAKEFNIHIRDIPRDPGWWSDRDAPDLLVDHIQSEGFEVITEDEIRPGDAFLSKPFKTIKVCHCGIYMGDGLVYHHFGSPRSQRMSTAEPVYNLRSNITHWLRHKDSVLQPSANEG